MRIVMIEDSALKGVGRVIKGRELTEKDADIIELRRLVAYGKAKETESTKSAKPTPDEIKNDVIEKQKEKVSIKPKPSGLSSSTASGLKG